MYLVYILKSDNLSYVGMTNDFLHRWKQHNGLLKGGAKYTSRKQNWSPVCIIDGFSNKQEAMQCEWKIKNRRCRISRKLKGAEGRIRYLDYLLNNTIKWTSRSPEIKNQQLTIFINPEYQHLLQFPSEELYWIPYN